MAAQIALGDIAVEVVFKDIRNIHLSVYPPDGAVRVSAPLRMQLDTIRVFAISRLAWIRQQQARLRAQRRETPREYIDRESHYVWGKRYLLRVMEADAASCGFALALTKPRARPSWPTGTASRSGPPCRR